MVCARPVCALPQGGTEDEAAGKSQSLRGALVVSLPRSRADSPHRRRTQGINQHHNHLTEAGIHTQEVSCLLLKDVALFISRHMFPATCSVAEHPRASPRCKRSRTAVVRNIVTLYTVHTKNSNNLLGSVHFGLTHFLISLGLKSLKSWSLTHCYSFLDLKSNQDHNWPIFLFLGLGKKKKKTVI